MAVEHRTHPVVGVQFHPESAASEYGYAMLDRFLRGEHARPSELPNRADRAHADGRPRIASATTPAIASCRRRWSWSGEPAMSDQLPAVWVNGERQPADGCHISSRDRGFTLADGVFETMRAYSGAVFRLDRHLARLAQSLAALEIPEPPRLREWMLRCGARVGRCDASIRLTVTRGIGPAGVPPPDDPLPTVIVAVDPLPVFPAAIYKAGLTAHVASGRRNERSMTAGVKTLAYTDAVAALIEARRAGADEALFLDTEGHCSEATSSNLFVWTNSGTLLTPPVSCGALPGVTRGAILEIARARGMPGGSWRSDSIRCSNTMSRRR